MDKLNFPHNSKAISTDAKHEIIDRIVKKYDVQLLGRRTDVFSNAFKHRIAEYPTLVHVQTSGIPSMLVMTQFNGVPQTVIIDRRLQPGFTVPKMSTLNLYFDDKVFEDTVISGELVRGSDGWFFLADDILVSCGTVITKLMFRLRYGEMVRVLENLTYETLGDSVHIKAKRFFGPREKQELIKFISSVPYTTKGVCFRSTGPCRRDVFVQTRF